MRQQLAFVGLEGLLDRPVHRQGIPIKRRWDGEAFEPAAGSTAIVADRGVFDTDLLNAARHKAVHVLQPASVRALGQAGDVWRLDVRSPDSDLVVEAKFVIDATGRRTQFRRRQRHGAATLALCGRWLGPQVEAVRISAQSASWCWGAPTGPDESVLVCFVDPLEFRRAPGTVLDRYLELARVSEVLPDIDSLTLAGVPLTCDATAYVTNGETAGLLRVGDADVALDPLSSSGVQAAIQSALAAGPIVNTLLTPGEDGIAALEFWRSRRASRMFQHRRWTRQFYRDAFLRHSTSFWADRCGDAPDMAAPATTTPLPHPDQSIVLSEGARLVLAPCLTGTLVKRLGCVEHVNLPEPVAFVAGIHVPPLLLQASRPAPAARSSRPGQPRWRRAWPVRYWDGLAP